MIREYVSLPGFLQFISFSGCPAFDCHLFACSFGCHLFVRFRFDYRFSGCNFHDHHCCSACVVTCCRFCYFRTCCSADHDKLTGHGLCKRHIFVYEWHFGTMAFPNLSRELCRLNISQRLCILEVIGSQRSIGRR